MVLQPFSDSARVWEYKQLLCMAMRKLFLTGNVPFPPTHNKTSVHSPDLNTDTEVVCLLSNPGLISKQRYGRCHSITFPLSSSRWRCGQSSVHIYYIFIYYISFISLLPSVTPSLPSSLNQTCRTKNLRRYKPFQPFQTCFYQASATAL